MTKPNCQLTVVEFQAVIHEHIGVSQFLMGAADVMGVTPVDYSVRFSPPAVGHHLRGFTAVMTLLESSLTFETWPEREYAIIIALSCKSFSIDALMTLIQKSWDVKNLEVKDVFSRGLHERMGNE